MRFIKDWRENKAAQMRHYAMVEIYLSEILNELKIIKNIKVDKNIKKTLDAIDKWRNHIELKGGKKKWKK